MTALLLILWAGLCTIAIICLRTIQQRDALQVENLELRTDCLELKLTLETQLQAHKDVMDQVIQDRDQARALARLTNYDVIDP